MAQVPLSQADQVARVGGDLEVGGDILQSAGYGAYAALKSIVAEVVLSGANVALGVNPPAGAVVESVTARVTQTITGAAGFTLGDGTDVDKWGDITGTAVGTHAGPDNVTAGNPTAYASAPTITLTAKSSNFTGGKARVVVWYRQYKEPQS